MIGVGVGVGFGGVGLSPAWLQGRLVSRYGARLLSYHWCGDMPADGSSLPARVGAALTNEAAGRYTQTTINGRGAVTVGDVTACLQGTQADAIASIVAVMVPPALPVTGTQVGVAVGTSAELAANAISIIGSGVSALYTTDAWVHYVDGTATDDLTAGAHVIAATRVANTQTELRLGHTAGAYCWRAAHGCVITIKTSHSEAEILATTADLQRLFRL